MKNVTQNNDSDKSLILQHKNGNNKALGVLFQKYMHLIYGTCLKYLKNEEKSKDAVMDLYEHLQKALLQHEVENFKSWLYRVTYNHCMQILRKEKKRSEKNQKFQLETISFMEFPENEHLEIEKEKLLVHLESCIEELKETQKKCIEQFYLQERCYNEIAELTGFAIKKVKSYIQNGKRNLLICMSRKNETK